MNPSPTAVELAADHVMHVRDLHVEFPTPLGVVRALNGVSFDIRRGRVLGVVGESGCGKSITSRAIMRIIEPPGRITEGEILFRPSDRSGAAIPEINGDTGRDTDGDTDGDTDRDVDRDPEDGNGVVDITGLDPQGATIRAIRGAQIAMIFQEPMTSLNPVYTVGDQIDEAILLHQTPDRAEARKRTEEMLRRVGMPNPDRVARSYPHQLSGGMRQRAMIAMALSCHPGLLIADEPTTALDVTTEAQILELMRELQEQYHMSIMFITHSMGVVAQVCDEVIVMYLGRVVERASVDDIFYNPKHPYTVSLLRSIPRIGVDRHGPLEVIKGSIPDPYARVPGCPFHPRCPSAMKGLCDVVEPLEAPVNDSATTPPSTPAAAVPTVPAGTMPAAAFPDDRTHTVRCHLYEGCTPDDAREASGE